MAGKNGKSKSKLKMNNVNEKVNTLYIIHLLCPNVRKIWCLFYINNYITEYCTKKNEALTLEVSFNIKVKI